MNVDAKQMLDELSELQAQQDSLALKKAALIEAVYTPEIRAKLDEIEAEFYEPQQVVAEKIATLTEAVKAQVVTGGETVKGAYLMAVYSKGRVTWDGKKLDGMMALIPGLKEARKEGEASVAIRKIG